MWTTAAGGRGMAARNGMGRHPCERDFSERDTSTRPRERDFAGSGQPTRPIASPHDTASHGLRLVATIKLQRYLLESRVQIPGQAYFASSKPAPLHCRKIQACSVQETCRMCCCFAATAALCMRVPSILLDFSLRQALQTSAGPSRTHASISEPLGMRSERPPSRLRPQTCLCCQQPASPVLLTLQRVLVLLLTHSSMLVVSR